MAFYRTWFFGLFFVGLTASAGQSVSVPENDGTPHEVFPLLSWPLFQTDEVRSSQPEPAFPEREWHEQRARILSDRDGRVDDAFNVPASLRERTEFWFNIYTRYGQHHHVIHHVRFPWIIYEVINTKPMIESGRGPLWLRRERAQKHVDRRMQEIRKTLGRLARRKTFANLSGEEKKLFDRLVPVKGSRPAVFRLAATSVRSQLGQRDFFLQGLAHSTRYLRQMEVEFERQGLPGDLTRLPFVESSFNEAAVSKVGASGIWQIMPQTGKAYMIVNDQIDERNSPLKATKAAGRLLRSYHRALSSWPLAITAYNNGIGNIGTAIKRAGSRDLGTIIHRYHAGDFRFASSNFFTCFLAALYAERYSDQLFPDAKRVEPVELTPVRLARAMRARPLQMHIRQVTGISQEQLIEINRDLKLAFKRNARLPRGLTVYLPAGMAQVLRGQKQVLLVSR